MPADCADTTVPATCISSPPAVTSAVRCWGGRRIAIFFVKHWNRCASDTASEFSLWNERIEAGHVWQRRFYDFVVWAEKKRVEKLRYMHRNPVRRGLVL